jgi:pimeloyl-ACP methyl ester carboxylesterase
MNGNRTSGHLRPHFATLPVSSGTLVAQPPSAVILRSHSPGAPGLCHMVLKWPLTFCCVFFIAATCLTFGSARADDAYKPFDGEKSTWHDGFARYDFVMDGATLAITPFHRPANENFGIGAAPDGGRRCVVICPETPAAGNPWSWRGCYWDHQPQTEIELLKRGFHVAYIQADASLKPDNHWDAWYDYLTTEHHLSKKPVFIGMSRGGEYEFTWATTHPDKVSAIYGDNPAADDESLRRLPDLARNDVPILLVVGTIDPLLPRFATTIENIYQQFGGRISIMLKEGAGHHPHSLNDPTPIANFLEHSFQETPHPVPDFIAANRFSRYSYYSTAGIYAYFPQDGYYITCRGPAFVDSYDRYEVSLGFPTSVTIIAPGKEAAGRPWVFRAGYVARDALLDQALLAKGFHIVVGPVGFNADGPNHGDWDKLYTYLTDHGFSKKPVMEGAGGGAGAIYAWAIDNPGKVCCIYAENPILQTGNVPTQPIDELAPLAKAGVPILHVCGSLDPAYDDQTRVAQKRYKELGGDIKVIVLEGQGHFLAAQRDVKAAVDFVLSHAR